MASIMYIKIIIALCILVAKIKIKIAKIKQETCSLHHVNKLQRLLLNGEGRLASTKFTIFVITMNKQTKASIDQTILKDKTLLKQNWSNKVISWHLYFIIIITLIKYGMAGITMHLNDYHTKGYIKHVN